MRITSCPSRPAELRPPQHGSQVARNVIAERSTIRTFEAIGAVRRPPRPTAGSAPPSCACPGRGPGKLAPAPQSRRVRGTAPRAPCCRRGTGRHGNNPFKDCLTPVIHLTSSMRGLLIMRSPEIRANSHPTSNAKDANQPPLRSCSRPNSRGPTQAREYPTAWANPDRAPSPAVVRVRLLIFKSAKEYQPARGKPHLGVRPTVSEEWRSSLPWRQADLDCQP